MKIISLEMENFRQHSNSFIEFNDGITVISGVNGSGKSTILEAISWAIYGTEASRGTKDSIKWNKAPARSKVKVELKFALDNNEYRVVRELNKAEIYLNGNEAPAATTQDEVTAYLIKQLAMTRGEFFNTYFTGQKELGFLGNQKPVERKRFISKVLNYEKIKLAQDSTRVDKNALNNEIIGIKQGLGNYELLESEKKETKQALKEANSELEAKQKDFNANAAELGKLHPAWSKSKEQKDEYFKNNAELKFKQEKMQSLNAQTKQLQIEIEDLKQKEKELESLKTEVEEFKSIEQELLKLENLRKHEIERQKLNTTSLNIEETLKKLSTKKSELIRATENNSNNKLDSKTIKENITIQKQKIESLWSEWTTTKSELKASISQKEGELLKVSQQCSIIQDKGKHGNCPTCERPLADEFDKVTSNFQTTIETLSKEISELILKQEELEHQPESITKIKESVEKLEAELSKVSNIEIQQQEIQKQLISITQELQENQAKSSDIKNKLNDIPSGFDEELFNELKAKYNNLKQVNDKYVILTTQIESLGKLQTRLINFTKEEEKESLSIKTLESKLKEINFCEEEYKALEDKIQELEKNCQESQKLLTQSQSTTTQLQTILDRILKSEAEFKSKIDFIKEKEKDLNHLIELDKFYGQFLETLNNQARPEISELAGIFLEKLTDGRYSQLELNEKYEINLIDDGEVKPVISGGEEDVANLCVRIAISQMIAQRSGRPLSLLILDEVFGSLDESRRNNVITLLQNLNSDFEQIILITHIEELKDNLDNIIKVEYDEKCGSSVIRHDEFKINGNEKIQQTLLNQ